jgi:hypothetical protein
MKSRLWRAAALLAPAVIAAVALATPAAASPAAAFSGRTFWTCLVPAPMLVMSQ